LGVFLFHISSPFPIRTMHRQTLPRRRPALPSRPPLLRRAPAALALALAAALPATLAAAPYIEHLYPAGARRGQTLEIELMGRSIDGAREVQVSGDSVTGQVLSVIEPTEEQIREAKKDDLVASQTARLRLTIAPDAAPGVRDLRIMADSGLSNRFRFEIGTLPEVLEQKPARPAAGAGTASKAQILPALPVVVNGQCLRYDRDRFRFHATAGQNLLIQVKGRSIKPYLADGVPGWFQPKIALHTAGTGAAAGKLIEEADDFRFDPDPVLLWKVPADGDYEVEIWDAVSRGRTDLVYRMTIGELPFITDLYPLGARAGAENVLITATGINLPGATARRRASFAGKEPGTVNINIPAKPGPTNSLPFELGSLPETFEDERKNNDTQKTAQRVETPVTINGRISRPGDTDWYSFTAQKGEKLVIDVMARRLGSPLDARLYFAPEAPFRVAAREAGARPPNLSSDDVTDPRYGLITHHADPRLSVTIPEDGTYRVMLADTQGKGSPAHAYRLRIAPAQPDYELRITPDNLSVPAGGAVVAQIKAVRIDDFDGEIRLHVEDLPPGFDLAASTIPAGKNTAFLSLVAPRDAAPGTYAPRFRAEAEIEGKTVRHNVAAAEELMQAFFYYHTVPVAQSYLVVTAPPTFFVEVPLPAGAGPVELTVDQEVEIPVRITRRPLTAEEKARLQPAPAARARQNKPKQRANANAAAADPTTLPVRVTALRLGKGVSITSAQFNPGETEGVVKIKVLDPKRAGADGIFVIEGTQRVRGRKISIAAPAIPYKILPAPGQEPPPPPPEKKNAAGKNQ
jgi:hypothetical protein